MAGEVRRAAQVRGRLADLVALVAMARDEGDAAVLADVEAELAGLEDDVTGLLSRMLLDGPYDLRSAVVVARATAAEPVEVVLRRYRQWAQRHGLRVETVAGHPPREVILVIAGPFAYGLLRGAADVEVAPLAEDDDPIALRGDDLRVDVHCTRRPADVGTLGVTHLPTGVAVTVANDGRPAVAVAVRLIRSRLLVRRDPPGGLTPGGGPGPPPG